MLDKIKQDLYSLRDSSRAKVLQGFFKTGKGEYGEGDVFLGVVVPDQRKIAKKYIDISLNQLHFLVRSKIHEHRLTGFMLLDYKFQKGNQKEIFDFYIKNIKYANNWDIVDVTAPKVVGSYLLDKKKDVLYKLAKSFNLWERRIAIVSTFAFIRANRFEETLKISEMLLNDKHDLIHKAVGWMLREVGKRNQTIEDRFLRKHYHKMPRTMLRYAIERFDEKKRKFYMKR